jgi:hypothetical protein
MRELEYNASDAYLFGVDILYKHLQGSNVSKYLNNKYLQKDVDAFTQTFHGKKTKQTFEKRTRVYKQLSKHFTKSFLAECRRLSLQHHVGVNFYAQFRSVANKPSLTLNEYLNIIPEMSKDTWTQMLQQFVQDLDYVFTQMPKTKARMKLYRGVKSDLSVFLVKNDKSFTSTSTEIDSAQDFIEKNTKCCLITLIVPVGFQAIPMTPVTRYNGEKEVLLPRQKRNVNVAIENLKQFKF